MNDIAAPTILIVPGLRDHVPEHWQTLLEQQLPNAVSVPRMDAATSCRARHGSPSSTNRWRRSTDPSILVAHSAGVMIVVHWAQRHRAPDQGRAACGAARLRVAAARRLSDAGGRCARTAGCRRRARGCRFRASSRRAPTIRSDATSASRRSREAWGSKLVDLGNVGHLNPASGYGEWPQAEEFIRELCAAASTTGHESKPRPQRRLPRWRLARARPRALAGAAAERRHRHRVGVHRRSPGRTDATLCAPARHGAQRRRRRREGASPASTSPRAASCASAWRCSARASPSTRSAASAGTTAALIVGGRRRHDRRRVGAGPDARAVAPASAS